MINELNNLYDQELLIKQTHSTKDLIIWNYSRKVQYENLWNVHPLILKCRGLVTNSKGEIVSRCFEKFFNWEQLLAVNYKIPTGSFEVFEKMDGQLGLLFWYEDEWILVSRWSFTSIYAEKGRKLLEKYQYKKLDKDYTYIFEIIFKEGRIVCKYDFEDLVLLGRIEIISGIERPIHDIGFEDLGFVVVKKYDGINDYTSLKSMVKDDAEGYVIKIGKFRMKIKGEEYFRLHSILTKFSSRDIWRYLKHDLPIHELLQNIPDEFDKWVNREIDTMKKMYNMIHSRVKSIYYYDINNEEIRNRKDIALKILTYDKNLQGIFFNMYDEKDYSHLIWDQIYPKYSKPFTINDDEGGDI